MKRDLVEMHKTLLKIIFKLVSECTKKLEKLVTIQNNRNK